MRRAEPARGVAARARALNPEWTALPARIAPDGDADPGELDTSGFRVPACACGGMLKPDVVFFGENVPRARVEGAMAALERAASLLVVGSSLMVFSGYRFVRAARARSGSRSRSSIAATRAPTASRT